MTQMQIVPYIVISQMEALWGLGVSIFMNWLVLVQ